MSESAATSERGVERPRYLSELVKLLNVTPAVVLRWRQFGSKERVDEGSLAQPRLACSNRGRKRWTLSVHAEIILTDDHNGEVGAAFGDDSVPLRKRTGEGRRRRTRRRKQTWLGKFAIPIPLDISANEIRESNEVRRVETWNRTTQSYLCFPASDPATLLNIIKPTLKTRLFEY